MPNIGAPELIILLVVLLLVFGPKRLPEMGRSVGRGIREFKDSVSGNEKPEDLKANHPPAEVTPASESPAEVTPASKSPAEKNDTERVAS
jgi:sec-independent protein translocase protein TatA